MTLHCLCHRDYGRSCSYAPVMVTHLDLLQSSIPIWFLIWSSETISCLANASSENISRPHPRSFYFCSVTYVSCLSSSGQLLLYHRFVFFFSRSRFCFSWLICVMWDCLCRLRLLLVFFPNTEWWFARTLNLEIYITFLLEGSSRSHVVESDVVVRTVNSTSQTAKRPKWLVLLVYRG